MGIYLNDWAEDGEAQMLSDFGIDKDMLEGADVLFASYTYEDYSGSAFVLFKRNGKFFEVNGSHCSCFGLSESDYCGDTTSQWQPEEVTVEALRHRIENGNFYQEDKIKDAVLAALAPEPDQTP
jgi:hypothetical protein